MAHDLGAGRTAGERRDRACPGSASASTSTRSSPAAPAGWPGCEWPGRRRLRRALRRRRRRARRLPTPSCSAAGLGDIGGLSAPTTRAGPARRGAAVLEHVRAGAGRRRLAGRQRRVQLIATTPKLGPAPGRGGGGAVGRARRAGQRHGHHHRRARPHRPRRGPGRGGDRAGGAEIPGAIRARRLPAVSLRLYDTATRAVRDFVPLRAGGRRRLRLRAHRAGRAAHRAHPLGGHLRRPAPLADRGRPRRHLRPQRHRHRRQDPRQGRGAGRARGGRSAYANERALHRAPTTSSAACRRRTSRGPPATSPR